jgi:hypothetical protein
MCTAWQAAGALVRWPAACLAESGFPGEAALRELNRLWQESVNCERQDIVPVTRQQRECVQQWRRGG